MSSNLDSKVKFAASYGSDELIKKYTHHDDFGVRAYAAEHMPTQHLDHMVDDSSFSVRREVARRGDPRHMDMMVHDKDRSVRNKVAARSQKSHPILMHDEDVTVRHTVASHSMNREVLHHLSSDADPRVSHAAKYSLKVMPE